MQVKAGRYSLNHHGSWQHQLPNTVCMFSVQKWMYFKQWGRWVDVHLTL